MSKEGSSKTGAPAPYPPSRTPSRAGTPEPPKPEQDINTIHFNALKWIGFKEPVCNKAISFPVGEERTHYIRSRLLPGLKQQKSMDMVQKHWPPINRPHSPPMSQMTATTVPTTPPKTTKVSYPIPPTQQRVASRMASPMTQIPPTLPHTSQGFDPLFPEHYSDFYSREFIQELQEIPSLPGFIFSGILSKNRHSGIDLIKTHWNDLTRAQRGALEGLFHELDPLRNGQSFLEYSLTEQPEPYVPDELGPGLGLEYFGTQPESHNSPKCHSSVPPDVERRAASKAGSPQGSKAGSEQGSGSDEEMTDAETADEENEEAEEEAMETDHQTAGDKPWSGKTPEEYYQHWFEEIQRLLSRSDIPDQYRAKATQAVYDGIKAASKAKNIRVCDNKPSQFINTAEFREKKDKKGETNRSQSRGRSRDTKNTGKKDEKKKDIANLKKQVLETLKTVEQFEKDLSFLSKPEIVDLAARKNLAPKAQQKTDGTKKRDPKDPWGKGSSLVKGIKPNTLVLNHKESEMIDLDHLKSTLQKTNKDKELTFNRVAVAKSGAVVVETNKAMDHNTKKNIQQTVNNTAFAGCDATTELVRPTHSSLKFDFVPVLFEDGSEASSQDIDDALRAHPKWAEVKLLEPIKRIENKRCPGVATLLVKVIDDDKGSKPKELLKTFGRSLSRTRPP